MLKKGTPYAWTSVTDTAFQQLKQALVQAPVLAIPDFSKQFVVETGASDLGFGAVLMQEGHPFGPEARRPSPLHSVSGISAQELHPHIFCGFIFS